MKHTAATNALSTLITVKLQYTFPPWYIHTQSVQSITGRQHLNYRYAAVTSTAAVAGSFVMFPPFPYVFSSLKRKCYLQGQTLT